MSLFDTRNGIADLKTLGLIINIASAEYAIKIEKRKRQLQNIALPAKDPNTLIFSVYQIHKKPNPRNIYNDLVREFAKTLDRMGKGAFEDDNKRRRKITLHSFRRYVKGVISNLGFGDFSEYFIGHIGSTYYRKTEKEKHELFWKVDHH